MICSPSQNSNIFKTSRHIIMLVYLDGGVATLAQHFDKRNIILIGLFVEVGMKMHLFWNKVLVVQLICLGRICIILLSFITKIGFSNLYSIEGWILFIRIGRRIVGTMCGSQNVVRRNKDTATDVIIKMCSCRIHPLHLEGGHVVIAIFLFWDEACPSEP